MSIFHWEKRDILFLMAIVAPLTTFLYLFPHFLVRDTFFYFCIATLPISLIRGKSNVPFFGLAIALGILTVVMPTTIGTYLTVACSALFFLQFWKGKLHAIGLVHVFLASPFFIYLSTLVSFPLRIWLTNVVSFMLNVSGIANTANGNILNMDDGAFLVDSACSGIHLLSFGILFGTLILSLHSRKSDMSIYKMSIDYLLLLGLIIWGNIVRIYLLVLLNIREDEMLHEGVGLIIFVAQILVPFYYLVNRSNIPNTKETSFQLRYKFPAFKTTILSCLLLAVFAKAFIYMEEKEVFSQEMVQFENIEIISKDVAKIFDGELLIYVKSPVAPYRANHNPMVCWSGSGYAFSHIFKKDVSTLGQVNMAELKKGEDTLYTAWWFESGQSRTADQWQWRWHAFQTKERFYLVNATSDTKEKLLEKLEDIKSTQIIQQLETIKTNSLAISN